MTNSVRTYFTKADQLCVYLHDSKRGWGHYGQLFASRRSIEERNAVWLQLRTLLLERNQSRLEGIEELQAGLADSYADVAIGIETARAEVETVCLCGEVGTACEIVSRLAGKVAQWLCHDPGSWEYFPAIKMSDDLRALRAALEASDARFPFPRNDVHELRLALHLQRSHVLRFCRTNCEESSEPVREQPAGSDPGNEVKDMPLVTLAAEHMQEIAIRLASGDRIPSIAESLEVTRKLIAHSPPCVEVIRAATIDDKTQADIATKLGVDRRLVGAVGRANGILFNQKGANFKKAPT